ncbi:hypothetical protein GGI07_001850 [Coemansia sp. Benny D115]|nr:hypothetical protein GGI07_001850 [Coemansia sp. Benny D115]
MKAYWKHDDIRDEGRVSITNTTLWSTIKFVAATNLKAFFFYSVVLWTMLSIFFGANYKRNNYSHNVTIDLVNLDNGPIGQAISNAITSMPRSAALPVWQLNTKLDSIDAAREYARKDAYGVVVINEGLSSKLQAALVDGADYNANDAITLLVQSAHHPMLQLTFVQAVVAQTVSTVTLRLAVQQLAQYQKLGNDTIGAFKSPQILLRPIGFSTERVGFFDFEITPIMTPMALFVMFVCIMAPMMQLKFASYPVYKSTKHLHIYLILLGLIFVMSLYFSFFGALSFLAFKGPYYNVIRQGLPIDGGMFFKIWVTFFLALIPLGLWIKTLFVLLPPAFVAVPSLITIIPNLLSDLTPLETSPNFYKWFKATPFYNAGQLVRYIISGAHPRIGKNLGIMFGEIVVMLIALYFITMLHQRNVQLGIVDATGNYPKPEKHVKVTADEPAMENKDITTLLEERVESQERNSRFDSQVDLLIGNTTDQQVAKNNSN